MKNHLSTPFFDIVDLAIKVNLENRKKITNIKSTMSEYAWFHDFCTVKVNLGRGTGKTSYVIQRVKDGDVILVSNLYFKKFYLRNDEIKRKKIDIILLSEIKNNMYKGKFFNDCQFVYVDEPSLCFNYFNKDFTYENVWAFYNLFSKNEKEITFVFLGE